MQKFQVVNESGDVLKTANELECERFLVSEGFNYINMDADSRSLWEHHCTVGHFRYMVKELTHAVREIVRKDGSHYAYVASGEAAKRFLHFHGYLFDRAARLTFPRDIYCKPYTDDDLYLLFGWKDVPVNALVFL